MIFYVLAMGKKHLGPHVVVGYGIKIFWPGLFITSPDHLDESSRRNLAEKPANFAGCRLLYTTLIHLGVLTRADGSLENN